MFVRFEGFELDLETEELSRDGELLPLPPQPAKVLALLVRSAGRTLSRGEIQQHVWGDDHVQSELGLNSCIRKIRAVLGDDPKHPRFIKTLSRRGYRFVAAVDPEKDQPEAKLETAAGADRPSRRLVLAGLAVVGAVLLVLSLLWPGKSHDGATAGTVPPPPREALVAVLPFADLSEGADQQYLSDGLTQETIARLGKLEPARLAVVAPTTAMLLEGSDKGPVAIAAELGAQYLLEGSVRRENGRFRTAIRLIDGTTGIQLAAEVYESSTEDLLAAQATVGDRVAGWLVEQLAPGLWPPTGPASDLPSEVYETYLRGLHRLHQVSAEDYAASRDLFGQVVEQAPGFAPGWTGLAEAELWLHWFGGGANEGARGRSREAAGRALALDPALADAHLLLGYASLYIDFDFADAGRRFERAVAAQPGSARAQAWYAAYLSAVGSHSEAVERARLARRLDPLAMAVRADLCWLLNYARRFDEAVGACSNALELAPGDPWTSLGKAEALRQLGRGGEAVEVVATLVSDHAIGAGWLELAEADAGLALDQAWKWLEERVDTNRPTPVSQAYISSSLAALRGKREEALDWLEVANGEREMLMVFVGVDPRFDTLRDAPRFRQLLAGLGLAEPAALARL